MESVHWLWSAQGKAQRVTLSKLERKQKLPVCYFPNKGLPIQVQVRSKARARAVGASVHAYMGMRMHVPRYVQFQPNPKP